MTDPFELDDDAPWVEICDANGKRSTMRLLAEIGFAGKKYFVLGAHNEDAEEGKRGLLLLREDQTIDGAQEYVIADDEIEVENVVGRFVMQSIMQMVAQAVTDDAAEDDCPCGIKHRAGEYCYCDNPDYIQ